MRLLKDCMPEIRATLEGWQKNPILLSSLLKREDAARSNAEKYERDCFLRAVTLATEKQFDKIDTGFAYLRSSFKIRYLELNVEGTGREQKITVGLPGYVGAGFTFYNNGRYENGLGKNEGPTISTRRFDTTVFNEVYTHSRKDAEFKEEPRLIKVANLIDVFLRVEAEELSPETRTLIIVYLRVILEDKSYLDYIAMNYPMVFKRWTNFFQEMSKEHRQHIEVMNCSRAFAQHVGMILPLLIINESAYCKTFIRDLLKMTLLSIFQIVYHGQTAKQLGYDDNWLVEKLREQYADNRDFVGAWTGTDRK